METKDMKLFVYDLETYKEYFLAGGRYKGSKEIISFSINRWTNDMYKMAKFISDNPDIYWVGFNSLGFDAPVIEYIYREHQKWADFTNLEICQKISQFAQDIIEDQSYEIRPPYPEYALHTKNIDLMRTHHFDNENNSCSLKWLEFMMNMPNVEEMPIPWYQKDLTKEDCEAVYKYWINDLDATESFLDVTLGETERFNSDSITENHQGKNKIQIRLDMIEEYGFPETCLSWSDVKIGDEINLLGYCSLKGVSKKEVFELKKKRKPTTGFTFGQCIPDYVHFESLEFKTFFEKMKKVRVNLRNKEEFPFEFRGTKYMIAKGGLHSKDPRRIVEPKNYEILRDADIGSQYPNAIFKRKLFPKHLGQEWLVNYGKQITNRLANKAKGNDDTLSPEHKRKFTGLAEMGKLSLNGGGFGKTNEVNSWQYDPFVHFQCTIGNQFEVLMLIETLELEGIKCVSANTDGIVCLFHKDKEKEYIRICKEWEVKVGNDKQGMLEYADYKKLIQENVNHYIAVKPTDKLKVKGRLNHISPLNKNNTKDITRIQRVAIQQYFSKGTPVEETIKKSEDIFMFVFGLKTNRNFHFEIGEQELKKMIRIYVSPSGDKLRKVKNDDSDSTGVDSSSILQGEKIVVYNNHTERDFKLYDIDYQFYIDGAQIVINDIEAGKKGKGGLPNPNQQSLF